MNKIKYIEQCLSDEIRTKSHLLDASEYEWFMHHAIKPQQIKVTTSPDAICWKEVWLITDGNDNSVYKVVFDEDTESFGLICTLDIGIEWYMGSYGNLVETIKSI